MKKLLFVLSFAVLITACSRVPITGRKQVHLLPESQMIAMSLTAYSDFLKESEVVGSGRDYTAVKRVSDKLIPAVESVLKAEGYEEMIADYQWE
ncbi:MAG TPA: M48 family peptidase, partial [Chitinophagales bacterium]|nr:M48 family peptidase [Chitinophagales bacterium]